MPEPGLGFNKGCHGNDTETMVCSDDESNSFSLEANSSGYHQSVIYAKLCTYECISLYRR